MVKKKISGFAVPELIQVWKQKETDCPIYLEWLTINAECSSILFLVTAEGAIAICFLKWAITDLFFRLFLVFSNKQYIVYNKCGQCQYSISCSNSNPRLLEHESPPITRPRPVFSPLQLLLLLHSLNWPTVSLSKMGFSPFSSARVFRRHVPAKSCAGSFAKLQLITKTSSETSRRSQIHPLSTKSFWITRKSKNKVLSEEILSVSQCDQIWRKFRHFDKILKFFGYYWRV